MNRTKAKELLPVITAFANGEDVQFQNLCDGIWVHGEENPSFSHYAQWRIAPKPKTCERWCFAVFKPAAHIEDYDTEEAAREAIAACGRHHPKFTFSPIVRVEFVEEKTA